MLVSACAGSSLNASAGPSSRASFANSFLTFAGCMRAHGVPGYPDPRISESGGEVHVRISPGSLNPSSPAFEIATRACHSLLPGGGTPGVTSAAQRAQGRAFAVCMRAHGVPTFPDPDPDRTGAFDLPSAIDQQAPQFRRALHACGNERPRSLVINQSPG